MGYKVLMGCGCAGVVKTFDDLAIIDSPLLPKNGIQVVSLIFDGTEYLINEIFSNRNEFIDYFNEQFKIIHNFEGNIDGVGATLYYQNIEEFENIEIVAIYQNYLWCFSVGSAPSTNLDPSQVITASNGFIFSDDVLSDHVLSVRIGSSNVEPITSDGYEHDPSAKTLTFANEVSDINIYVETKQVPV